MSGGVMEWPSVGFVSSLSVQDRWAELQEVVRSRFLGQASQRRAGGALHSAWQFLRTSAPGSIAVTALG
jgi:hypothetical protein